MDPNKQFRTSMESAESALATAAHHLDLAVEALKKDGRPHALIHSYHYAEGAPLKSARSRVKALHREIQKFSLAMPNAVITPEDVEGTLIHGGTKELQDEDEWARYYLLVDNRDVVVAHLIEGKATGWLTVRPPREEDL